MVVKVVTGGGVAQQHQGPRGGGAMGDARLDRQGEEEEEEEETEASEEQETEELNVEDKMVEVKEGEETEEVEGWGGEGEDEGEAAEDGAQQTANGGADSSWFSLARRAFFLWVARAGCALGFFVGMEAQWVEKIPCIWQSSLQQARQHFVAVCHVVAYLKLCHSVDHLHHGLEHGKRIQRLGKPPMCVA